MILDLSPAMSTARRASWLLLAHVRLGLELRQYSSNDISVRARALTRSKPLSMPSDV